MTVGRSIRTNAPAAAGSGLPAKRLSGRQVVVLLGASEPALSVLSRTLQALGVDMLDAPAGNGSADPSASQDSAQQGPAWRRDWIFDLNVRILQAVARAPDHFAHALPFPPGWWRRPAVQALKREAITSLEAALDSHDDLWGFADPATARLLPVWDDVFEQLGLTPLYVWSLTHPTQAPAVPGADPATAAAAAEVRWFAYSADIFRYGADHLACVVDEDDWRTDPQGLMERLVEQLHLRWRGTRLDLYETVSAVVAEGMDASGEKRPARPASLPLSMSFYRSAKALFDEPDARERLRAMVDSAELLRPLIAPFLARLDGAQHLPTSADGEEDVEVLRQEIAALRETCASLRHAASATPQPDSAPPSRPAGEQNDALELELQSRMAEIRWLHDRHAAEISEAQQEIELLRRQVAGGAAEGGNGGQGEDDGSAPATAPSGADSAQLAVAQAEVARLQAEMVTLTNANERYLARIYELKKALEDHGAFERVGR